MNRIITLAATFLLLGNIVPTFCQNTHANTMSQKPLVVFFSHAGENYSVGNIEVGNTKIVADYISEITAADQFEVVAEKSYDMPYMDLIKWPRTKPKPVNCPLTRVMWM